MNNDIKVLNYNRIGPLNYLSFDEAKKYIRENNIVTVQQYRDLYKAGKIDPDLPAAPEQFYKNEGYTTWGDFSGSGSYQSRKTLSIEEFTEKVRELGIRTGKDFLNKLSLEDKIKYNLPSNPQKHYKIKKFSWGKILGTGYEATFKRKYKSLKAAKSFLKPLKIPSNSIYEYWISNGEINNFKNKDSQKKALKIIKSLNLPNPPNDLPKSLIGHYGKKGKIKISSQEILGNNEKVYIKLGIDIKRNDYWNFKKAHDYVKKIPWSKLQLKSNVPGAGVANKWRAYCRGLYLNLKKPDKIPFEPPSAYPKEWKGWNHWTGSASFNFWDYDKCVSFMSKINFQKCNIPKKYLVKKNKKKTRGKYTLTSYVGLYGRHRTLFEAYKNNELKGHKFNKNIPRSPSHYFDKKKPFDWEEFLGLKN